MRVEFGLQKPNCGPAREGRFYRLRGPVAVPLIRMSRILDTDAEKAACRIGLKFIRE